jgi:hypothetical protein
MVLANPLKSFFPQYGRAEDILRSGRKGDGKQLTPQSVYAQSAVYICAAHALKPDYPVSRLLSFLLAPLILSLRLQVCQNFKFLLLMLQTSHLEQVVRM